MQDPRLHPVPRRTPAAIVCAHIGCVNFRGAWFVWLGSHRFGSVLSVEGFEWTSKLYTLDVYLYVAVVEPSNVTILLQYMILLFPVAMYPEIEELLNCLIECFPRSFES